MSVAGLPKACVVGAGAIGIYLGAHLADGHAQVSVLARGSTLDAIRRRGLVLESGGRRLETKVTASAEASDLGVQDLVIVAVKSPSLAHVAPLIAPLVGSETLILPVLNGIPWWFPLESGGDENSIRLRSVDPDGVIARSIPMKNTVGSVVYPSCSSPEPGVSRHASGSRLVFGEVYGGTSDRVGRLVAHFRQTGLGAEQTGDIRSEVWQKLLGNACYNPVSLLTGSTTDKLIDDPAVHSLFHAMMQEILAVGSAIGIHLDIKPSERIAITRKLGSVKTSMLQDVEAGRAVELEGILGGLIETAGYCGVRIPSCEVVYALARMRASVLGLLPASSGG
jgi:2-dehydropantoate 2-reductase